MKSLSTLKIVFVNILFIILPLFYGVILLFSTFTGFLGTWIIFNDWIISPSNTGWDANVVFRICILLSLLGGGFIAYITVFWLVRVFPPPPSYVIWRSKKRKDD